MLESSNKQEKSLFKTICNDCVFHVLVEGAIECINPDKVDVKCSAVTFCNCFQPMHEVESPCVAYGQDEKI